MEEEGLVASAARGLGGGCLMTVHHRWVAFTYLHKHPTSDNTDRPEHRYGRFRASGPGYYVILSRILDLNFGELTFHALG